MDDSLPVDQQMCDILSKVLAGKMEMREAREKLRAWHGTLDQKNLQRIHNDRASIARRITSAADGFAQELLIIASSVPGEQ